MHTSWKWGYFLEVWSAVEGVPADVVAPALVVEDQVADGFRELGVLPAALLAAGFFTLFFRGRCTGGADGVGGGAQLVCGDMSHGRGLGGSESGVTRRAGQDPCGGIGMAGGVA